LPVYFELQDEHSTQPLGQLLADLAVAVTKAANLEPLARNVFDDQGHFFRDTFFPRLLGELGGERRLLFLLDEFDMLVRATRPTTSKAFLSFLRRLMRDTPWAAFLFIMGKGVAELSPDLIAIFKDASVGELWLLDQKSTEQLIRQAETNGTLKFSEQAVASILNLTDCKYYITIWICKQIWDRAYIAKPTAPPLIDMQDVEEAVPDILFAGKQALNWWWNGLSPAEKIDAAALAEIATQKLTIREERVMQQGSWEQAVAAFLQIVNRRVAYQKDGRRATQLLDQVTKEAPPHSFPAPFGCAWCVADTGHHQQSD